LDSDDFQALAFSDNDANKDRKVELYLTGGQKYQFDGVQDFQDNKVDVSTGTVTMRATFNNPNNELIHGAFVTVKLYANKPVNVPVVPVTAVQENQAGKFVYKIDENSLPQLIYIKTSGQDGDNWIVSEGLKKGDKVVIEGLQKVIPGKPVTIVSAEEMQKIKSETATKEEEDNK
jgi:membrane fusion protein (multidrug efflux system)